MKISTSKVNCNRYGNKGNNPRLRRHTESMIERTIDSQMLTPTMLERTANLIVLSLFVLDIRDMRV